MTEPPLLIDRGDWTRLGSEARAIRYQVFVEEQQVPEELELDALDPLSVHLVGRRGDTALATARLTPDGHIGRVAVLPDHRGYGIGQELVKVLIGISVQRGDPVLELNAQTSAVTFYQRLGFDPEGPVFLDAGLPHRRMRYVAKLSSNAAKSRPPREPL